MLNLKKTKLFAFWPVIVAILVVCIYFYKTILKAEVPFPGDMLVGGYFPWLEHKWGYVAGVPIKNSLISDVFSQMYVWKKIITESYMEGRIPLWNSYSYSGYPLLANFQSGALSVFNLLFIAFGQIKGWSANIILTSFGSWITMYMLLRCFKYSKTSSLIGGFTYSFSGFAITWSQFLSASQAMVFMPLMIMCVEKFAVRDKSYQIWLLPVFSSLLVFSGHFQSVIYGYLITLTYLIYRFWGRLKKLLSFRTLCVALLMVLLPMIQILPTLELASLSIRFEEGYIKSHNYGLLSLVKLITLLAPDYLGNPATNNYWGTFNYHETVIYLGILSVWALIYSFYNYKKLNTEKFFLITAVLSMLLMFDSPFGRIIYWLKIPGLSTSAAGRIAIIWALSGSILIGNALNKLESGDEKYMRIFVWLFLALLVTFFFTLTTRQIFLNYQDTLSYEINNLKVGLRNLAIPIALISMLMISIRFFSKRIVLWAIFLITIMDLFRFGWKYTPFVPSLFVFPKTEVIDYLNEDKSLFRVDREKAEIMTPNTWAAYQLMSPSGYDPMALVGYVSFYQKFLNDLPQEIKPSRYSELQKYDAEKLGEFSVKYLMAIKRDKLGIPGGDNIDYRINPDDWKRVYETKTVAILENKFFKPKIGLINDGNINDSLKVDYYDSQKINISYKVSDNNKLIIRESWYPGWTATINGKSVEVKKYKDVFQQIDMEEKEGTIKISYLPMSFILGGLISIGALLLCIGGFAYDLRKIKGK